MARAQLDKQPRQVAGMFDEVAAKYDLANSVLTAGMDRSWRREVVRGLDLQPGQRLLDLAAGTGVSSVPFVEQGVRVVPCDFSLGMMTAGRRVRPGLPFVAGDATRLPFADESFDAVTIMFGLRNVVDVPRALREMRRVVRPGGKLLVCEFSQPTWAPWRALYARGVLAAVPPVARAVSSSPDSYVYLADSIRAWPAQQALAQLVAEAGWSRVQVRNLLGGVVALHRAVRP